MHLLTPSQLGLLAAFLGSSAAEILSPLNSGATPGASKFQPVLDFDTDSCYQATAIDPSGHCNEGLEPGKGNCRQEIGNSSPLLGHSQTYVRQRCNHGWCAYLYGYYFEKDDGAAADNHRHDWEHIIVWTLNDEKVYVSWSGHGDYTTEHHTQVRWEDGTHPKIVYHRGGIRTHSFRKATADDDNPVENITKRWHKSSLASLEMMDCGIKRQLLTHDWGSAHPDVAAGRFGGALQKAIPWDAANNQHFDPWH